MKELLESIWNAPQKDVLDAFITACWAFSLIMLIFGVIALRKLYKIRKDLNNKF